MQERLIYSVLVKGVDIGPRTECLHYRSPEDIIAIRFKCCDTYFPCFECHDALASHEAVRWTEAEFDQAAILCGACGAQLTIAEYLGCNSKCPKCSAPFNPGCERHHGLYFESK